MIRNAVAGLPPAETEDEASFTAAEIASHLGVAECTVRANVPASYRASDVAAWIESCRIRS